LSGNPGGPLALVSGLFLGGLLRFHVLVELDLAVALEIDNAMKGFVPGERDVDHVVPGIQQKINRRGLVDHAAVNGDLCALGLRFHRDFSHTGALVATEQLAKFADSLDVVSDAERFEHGSELECLPGNEVCCHSLVEVAFLAHQYGVISFFTGNLRGSYMPG
jgi:hypothetical protein